MKVVVGSWKLVLNERFLVFIISHLLRYNHRFIPIQFKKMLILKHCFFKIVVWTEN